MNYTREQLIEALCEEYDYLCHDDFDPDVDLTSEEYRKSIENMSKEDLILETSTDEHFTLEEFMDRWCNL